jgi:hypothetical protein
MYMHAKILYAMHSGQRRCAGSVMTVAAGGQIFCFVVLLKSLATIVKEDVVTSVSDGLRD